MLGCTCIVFNREYVAHCLRYVLQMVGIVKLYKLLCITERHKGVVLVLLSAAKLFHCVTLCFICDFDGFLALSNTFL